MPDNDDEPITPEVVDGGDGTPRRGASSRKRRVNPGGASDGPAPDEAAPTPPMFGRRGTPTGTMFRTACILLVGFAVLELVLAGQRITDPEAAQCAAARFDIDEANDDDEDFNDVELPDDAEEADDVACDDAVALAGNIPEDEDEEADGEYLAASAFRTQGIIVGVLGLLHGLGGFFTLRTKQRRIRNLTLAAAAFGILFPLLGIISSIGMIFVVYGLAFSADARHLFPPDPNRPGLFRPRPPAAS